MNRLTRYSSAAFGMVLLAGLAYYQGEPDMMSGDEGSMMGTATFEPEAEDLTDESTPSEAHEEDCDPSRNPDDPDFENCEKLSQK